MPNNYVVTNGGIFVPDTPADSMILQTIMLFRADKGLLDLRGNDIFDTKTVALTSTYIKFGDSSAEFDGTTNKQLISSNGTGGQIKATTAADQWCVEAWVYPISNVGNRAICGNQGVVGGAGTFSMLINPSGQLVWSDNIVRVTTSQTVPLNQWSHVCVQKDGPTGATAWVNGLFDIQAAQFGGNYNTTAGFSIGGRTDGTLPFRGGIDSVRVTKGIRYSTNFTPAQFADH